METRKQSKRKTSPQEAPPPLFEEAQEAVETQVSRWRVPGKEVKRKAVSRRPLPLSKPQANLAESTLPSPRTPVAMEKPLTQGPGQPAGQPPLFALRGTCRSGRLPRAWPRPGLQSIRPIPWRLRSRLAASRGCVMGSAETNSLPDRLNSPYRDPGRHECWAQIPYSWPTLRATGAIREKADDHHEVSVHRTSAVISCLVSTAWWRVCAEFMVDSINGLVETSGIGEIFIGLIVPIVGNAAEHVTAITVAMKNKMTWPSAWPWAARSRSPCSSRR